MDIQCSSLQKIIFSQLPGLKCFRKVARSSHTSNRFVTTGGAEKGKSSGQVFEDVVENIRDHLEEHPRTSLTRLSLQTSLSWQPVKPTCSEGCIS
jgi:hypothetical protein